MRIYEVITNVYYKPISQNNNEDNNENNNEDNNENNNENNNDENESEPYDNFKVETKKNSTKDANDILLTKPKKVAFFETITVYSYFYKQESCCSMFLKMLYRQFKKI